jgi:hypothetical protein
MMLDQQAGRAPPGVASVGDSIKKFTGIVDGLRHGIGGHSFDRASTTAGLSGNQDVAARLT